MLGKNRIKLINSLQLKKYRRETGLFAAEGTKVVLELLRSNLVVRDIFATAQWHAQYAELFAEMPVNIEGVAEEEMKKISAMQTACPVVAIVEMPQIPKSIIPQTDNLYIALDSVRDPGNFGTIIRIANWFGIKSVVCSPDCVDVFNPKVVQAAMGSVFRMEVVYQNLVEFFNDAKTCGMPIFGTFLDGQNIYQTKLPRGGVIVLGNEGHGILPQTEKHITNRLNIPCGCEPEKAPESLNVSAAAAIVCSEFVRQRYL